MADPDRALRNISDTAAWAAFFRARETERPDALFRDPFAKRLAGGRGEQIAARVPNAAKDAWAWVTRTHLFDHFLTTEVEQGADTVVNLAAGLDARPYRLASRPPSDGSTFRRCSRTKKIFCGTTGRRATWNAFRSISPTPSPAVTCSRESDATRRESS